MKFLKQVLGGIAAAFKVFIFQKMEPKRELNEDPQITKMRGIPLF